MYMYDWGAPCTVGHAENIPRVGRAYVMVYFFRSSGPAALSQCSHGHPHVRASGHPHGRVIIGWPNQRKHTSAGSLRPYNVTSAVYCNRDNSFQKCRPYMVLGSMLQEVFYMFMFN